MAAADLDAAWKIGHLFIVQTRWPVLFLAGNGQMKAFSANRQSAQEAAESDTTEMNGSVILSRSLAEKRLGW
jgi:hypothetical protein